MPNDQTKQYSTNTPINHDFSHDKSHGYYTLDRNMNKNIEKFLLWACIFKVLAMTAPMAFSSLTSYLIIGKGIESSSLIFLSTWAYMLCTIPLRFVCGAWLKSESESLGVNQRIWFWTGFFFEFIGILVFYAYLAFCKKTKVQPVR